MYITQEATITQKTSKTKTEMLVSRATSESIRNMNETKNSNEKRNEVCNMMKQHPNILQETKRTKTIRVSRVDLKNRHVYDKSESRTYGQWCPNELKFEL